MGQMSGPQVEWVRRGAPFFFRRTSLGGSVKEPACHPNHAMCFQGFRHDTLLLVIEPLKKVLFERKCLLWFSSGPPSHWPQVASVFLTGMSTSLVGHDSQTN